MSEVHEASIWSHDALWQKAKVYVDRALEQDLDGPLFPHWATLGLELVARSVLARVHPVLLADPREPESIFFALGVETRTTPRSIPTKTVFARCQRLIDEFTDLEASFCMGLMERRNSELHTGALPFAGLRTADWLADYYRVLQILLSETEKSLEELLGDEEAKAAEEMIDSAVEETKAEVLGLIAAVKKVYLAKSEEVQESLQAKAEEDAKGAEFGWRTTSAECPACGNRARVSGELIRWKPVQVNEDRELISEAVVLPTKLSCAACELQLSGYNRLQVAGVGGQFVKAWSEDPVEFHGIDPSALIDPYMNE